MKIAATILLFLASQYSFATNTTAEEALASSLAQEFPTIHQWTSRCTTETYLTELKCTVNPGNTTDVDCQGKGYDSSGHPTLVNSKSRELIDALRISGFTFNNEVEVKNLSCERFLEGFANCGTGREEVTCTFESYKGS